MSVENIFGIDHGNGNIKTENDVFPCGLIKLASKPTKAFAQDVIEYKSMYYILSDTRMPYKTDKTTDLDYFILTLFALVNEANKREGRLSGKDIVLSTGLPPADCSQQGEKFRKYFEDETKNGLEFIYNDKKVNCHIKKVMVLPQNYSAVKVFKNTLLKDYKTVYCIDIGDGTVDLLVFKNGKPDLKVNISKPLGIAVMRSEIINSIQQDFGYQLDNDVVEEVLLKKNTVLSDKIKCRISEMTKEWTDKIVNELHPYVPDFRINPTVFMGGGTSILKPYIVESAAFGEKEYIEDIKANAIGYAKIAELMMKRES